MKWFKIYPELDAEVVLGTPVSAPGETLDPNRPGADSVYAASYNTASGFL